MNVDSTAQTLDDLSSNPGDPSLAQALESLHLPGLGETIGYLIGYALLVAAGWTTAAAKRAMREVA